MRWANSGGGSDTASSGAAATTFPIAIGGVTQVLVGSTYLSIGTSASNATTPATTGTIRGDSTFNIVARNSGNTANYTLIANVSNQVVVGNTATQTIVQALGYNAFRSAAHYFQTAGGGADIVVVESTKLTLVNTTAAPAGTPSGGGFLYSEAGALKWKGSSGTVTTIAVA